MEFIASREPEFLVNRHWVSECGYYYIAVRGQTNRFKAGVSHNTNRVDISVVSYVLFNDAVKACELHEQKRFLEEI